MPQVFEQSLFLFFFGGILSETAKGQYIALLRGSSAGSRTSFIKYGWGFKNRFATATATPLAVRGKERYDLAMQAGEKKERKKEEGPHGERRGCFCGKRNRRLRRKETCNNSLPLLLLLAALLGNIART